MMRETREARTHANGKQVGTRPVRVRGSGRLALVWGRYEPCWVLRHVKARRDPDHQMEMGDLNEEPSCVWKRLCSIMGALKCKCSKWTLDPICGRKSA